MDITHSIFISFIFKSEKEDTITYQYKMGRIVLALAHGNIITNDDIFSKLLTKHLHLSNFKQFRTDNEHLFENLLVNITEHYYPNDIQSLLNAFYYNTHIQPISALCIEIMRTIHKHRDEFKANLVHGYLFTYDKELVLYVNNHNKYDHHGVPANDGIAVINVSNMERDLRRKRLDPPKCIIS